MSVRLKLAEIAREIDAVFALRHNVFVDEGYMAPRADERIYDRFDAFPGTVNIIAVVDDQVVGAVRYMRPTEVGSSVVAFLRRHHVGHWLQAFEREFHGAGDVVVRRGDEASSAYVIASGRAAVLDGRGKVVAHLEPGDLFGELALLSHCPRTATVRAASDLDLMVIQRSTLRAQLRENPAAAEQMLELLANRLAVTLLGDEAPSSLMRAAKVLRVPLDRAHANETTTRRRAG